MKAKRYISLLLALCLSLSLYACSGSTSVPSTPSSTPSGTVGTESETAKPEVTPDVTEPETTEPETTEPETTEPETTEPETTEPETTEPEVTEPEVTEPEVTEPEDSKKTEPENGSGTSDNVSDNASGNGDVVSNEEENVVPPVETPENPPVEAEHTHKYTSKKFTPSCSEEGYTLHECECGDSYVDGYIPRTGLCEYAEKVIAPTYSEKGYTMLACIKCGYVYAKYSYVNRLSDFDPNWTKDKTITDENGYEILELDKVSVNLTVSKSSGLDIATATTEAEIMEYVNSAAPSDFEGQKVGINHVDAENPANMRLDNEGNLGFSLNYQPEGTLMSHSALNKTGAGQKSVDYFLDTMVQIDKMLKRGNDSTLYRNNKSCGQYFYEDGFYELSFKNWGNSWIGGGTSVTRNVALNALAYFGGEKMGVAVWSMLEEHLHYRDATYLISDELAAKYGLKIVHNGTLISLGMGTGKLQASAVRGLKVTDGTQTWLIDYPLCGENMNTIVYIPT